MKKFLSLTLVFCIAGFVGCDKDNTVLKPTEEEAAELQKKREELMESGGAVGGARDMKPKR
ncbi:MAG: hypothetical protein AAFV88_06720 [Planctomycetota bacterium]